MHGSNDRDGFTAIGVDKRFDRGQSQERCSLHRNACSGRYLLRRSAPFPTSRLGYLLLAPSESPLRFVADDVGSVAIDLRDETSAKVGSQRFVRYDRQPLVYVVCESLIANHDQRFSTARLGRVAQDFFKFGFERHNPRASGPAGGQPVLGAGLSGHHELVPSLRPNYTCSQRRKRDARGFLALQFGPKKSIVVTLIDFPSISFSNLVPRNHQHCTKYKRSECRSGLLRSLACRAKTPFTKSHSISAEAY